MASSAQVWGVTVKIFRGRRPLREKALLMEGGAEALVKATRGGEESAQRRVKGKKWAPNEVLL